MRGALYAGLRRVVPHVADFPESMFQPVLEITLPGARTRPSLRAEIDRFACGEYSVDRITVLDSRLRTQDGLGVGTTERELRRKVSFTISEEEGCHCAIIKPLEVTFQFGGPAASQRVSSVMLWSSPEAVHAKRCPDGHFHASAAMAIFPDLEQCHVVPVRRQARHAVDDGVKFSRLIAVAGLVRSGGGIFRSGAENSAPPHGKQPSWTMRGPTHHD